MAGQVRVLQLEAEQELEAKLYRLEKGKVLLLQEPTVLGQVSELVESLIFMLENEVTVQLEGTSAESNDQKILI